MLEKLFLSNNVYYLMGAIFTVGVIIKAITGNSLNHLVREVRDVNKSLHPFIKLVKAKFEHAFMVNGKVDNIDVFVDKFIREYKVGGLSIHVWSKVKAMLIVVLILVGGVSSIMTMDVESLTLQSLEKGVTALVLSLLLLLAYFAVDERYRLATLKVYMVDHLENVLSRRLEKSYVKETVGNVEEVADKELRSQGEAIVEMTTDTFEIEQQSYQESTSGITMKQVEVAQEEKSDEVPTAAMLREILQEFMA